ncbi:MAG TPA: hypothetical protein VGO11_25900 [Chthoniobacteraceae bacterium]|jgi:hypothetical protein|nr:hypothetical protein [Chthoniobacteraceae bacterium]
MIGELIDRWSGRHADEFTRMAADFRERCRRWPLALPANARGPRVGVVITPWMRTAVAFFSLECARELARQGARPVLLWDEANVFFNTADRGEVKILRDLLNLPDGPGPVLDVAATPPDPRVETSFVDQLVYENAVREARGEAGAPALLARAGDRALAMREHAARVHALLLRERFDWLFVPGGVWASSGIWTEMAARQHLPITTYDSGAGSLFVCHGGAAAHFPDVAEAFRALRHLDREPMIADAQAALETRMAGRDVFKLQPHAAGHAEPPCDLLVPLNYRSDTAALHRQRAFRSVTHWLTQLLHWVMDRPGISVAIRQHPCERIPAYRGTDQWREILAPHQERLGARMRFVAAEDPVNTYDLLAGCRAVLPWTSRAGVEAAMLGKPVVLGTWCYYMGLGFTADAASPAEYFSALELALENKSGQSAEARRDAALIYYIIERRLSLTTSFTPQPVDYSAWAGRAPARLWSEPAQRVLREALLSRRPVALLQDGTL